MHHCVSSVLHIYHLRLSVKPKALPVRCPCGLYSGVPAKTSYEKQAKYLPHAHDSTGKGSACPHPCRRSVYGTCIDTGVCGAVQCRDIGRNFALHVPAAFSHERIFPVKPPHRVPVPMLIISTPYSLSPPVVHCPCKEEEKTAGRCPIVKGCVYSASMSHM